MEREPRAKATGGQSPRTGLWLGGSIARRLPSPDRRSFVGSAVFHVVLLVAFATATIVSAAEPEFEAFRVKIISPPPQVRAEPEPTPPQEAPKIVATPEETRPVEKPKPAEPEVKRPVQTPVADTTPKTPPEEPKPVAGLAKPDSTSPGGSGLNVDIAGAEFPFPEYLENIVTQMYRYFRWEGTTNPSARVTFCINRDGSVTGLRLRDRSSDWDFNTKVLSAVENAGKRSAFGPLPEGWVQDRLCVNFGFIPQGR
jgi:outer membrane biosynthesis protein TonB